MESEEKFLYKDLTYKIIGLAMEAHNELGFGFLEKVYENAMMIQFKNNDIKAERQVPIDVYFKENIVGQFYPDIIVENKVIIELKAVDKIIDIHKGQLFNYLKATNLKIGLILNFGTAKLEYERFIYD